MSKPASSPVPPGMNTITISLWYNGDCRQAIELYKKAFGAKPMGEIVPGEDEKTVLHAMMQIGNSHIMMADSWPNTPEKGPEGYATAGLWLYVEDCDQLFEQARKAGCEVIMPMADQFWGDRMGKVRDPFGHCWAIATFKWEHTKGEIKKGEKEWLDSLKRAA